MDFSRFNRKSRGGILVPDSDIDIPARRGRCDGLMHSMLIGGVGVSGYNYVRLYIFSNRAGATSGQNYCYDFQLLDASLVNILTGGTASASSVYSIQTADKAFDGNYLTYHANNSGDYPYYIQYQTVSAVNPLIMSLRCSNLGAWEVRVSNDSSFSSYVTIASSAAGDWNTENSANYPFYYGLEGVEVWDINITSAGSSGTGTQALIKGFEIRNSSGVNLLTGGFPIYSSTTNTYSQITSMLANFNGSNGWSNYTSNGDTVSNGKVRFGYILPPNISIISSAATLALASLSNSNYPKTFAIRRKNIGSIIFNEIGSYSVTWPGDNSPQTFAI